MYAGLFSEWNSFYSDSTPIPYPVRIYPMSEFIYMGLFVLQCKHRQGDSSNPGNVIETP